MKTNYYIRPETGALRLWVSMFSERKPVYNTDLKPGKNWDKKKQIIKESVTGAKGVNEKLKGYTEKVRKEYERLMDQGIKPTFEALEKVFEVKHVEPVNETSFLSFMEDQIDYEYRQGFTSETTWKHEKVSLGKLKRFGAINFDTINEDMYKKLIVFLSTEGKKEVSIKNGVRTEATTGLLNNSIGTVIKHLKKYCKPAFKKGLLKSIDFHDFTKPSENVFKITYTEDDILAVYKIKYIDPKVQEAVDLNTFKFYAGGLRHGDSQLIVGRENVINVKMKDGTVAKALYYSQEKTEQGNVVLLNKICLDILAKYDYKLPRFATSSQCNKHLKTAFRIAGYNRPVTIIRHSNKKRIEKTVPEYQVLGKSHTARYSAARMIVEKTGDLYLAKEILGHKKISTTEGYVQTSESFKHEGYSKVINPQ
jgi:site-specific recombinase XerD